MGGVGSGGLHKMDPRATLIGLCSASVSCVTCNAIGLQLREHAVLQSAASAILTQHAILITLTYLLRFVILAIDTWRVKRRITTGLISTQ